MPPVNILKTGFRGGESRSVFAYRHVTRDTAVLRANGSVIHNKPCARITPR